ncbi:MAG TPA: aminotransferase class V-fold PLP-dependent enzyme [bacterium]|nr:aminotransferase class V-fold PLP-dependent enzyme [bacterium]
MLSDGLWRVEDPYRSLGVRPLINAWGTLTRVGGSLMPAEVRDAMAAAAGAFVDLEDLHERAGAHLASLLGVPAAFVSSGAAAGLALASAACLAGDDPGRMAKLPDTTGLPHAIVIHRAQRNRYDQCLRLPGADLREFGGADRTEPWELAAALDADVVAVAYIAEFAEARGSLPFAEVVEIASRAGIPVLVDAAAELPPVENLWRFVQQGASLVVFSGGKDLRGPQATGLVLGREDLVRACRLHSNPNQRIGRPMKAGKEEIAGLVAAVERYLALDHAAEMARWESQVAFLLNALGDLPAASARRMCPAEPGIQPVGIPRVYIDLRPGAPAKEEVIGALREGDPAIVVGEHRAGLVLNPQTLQPGEEAIVASRLVDILSRVQTRG